MGQPNWAKIPFDKMPQWKKDEILAKSKKTVKQLEPQVDASVDVVSTEFVCEVCGKVCGSKAGLMAHGRVHTALLN